MSLVSLHFSFFSNTYGPYLYASYPSESHSSTLGPTSISSLTASQLLLSPLTPSTSSTLTVSYSVRSSDELDFVVTSYLATLVDERYSRNKLIFSLTTVLSFDKNGAASSTSSSSYVKRHRETYEGVVKKVIESEREGMWVSDQIDVKNDRVVPEVDKVTQEKQKQCTYCVSKCTCTTTLQALLSKLYNSTTKSIVLTTVLKPTSTMVTLPGGVRHKMPNELSLSDNDNDYNSAHDYEPPEPNLGSYVRIKGYQKPNYDDLTIPYILPHLTTSTRISSISTRSCIDHAVCGTLTKLVCHDDFGEITDNCNSDTVCYPFATRLKDESSKDKQELDVGGALSTQPNSHDEAEWITYVNAVRELTDGTRSEQDLIAIVGRNDIKDIVEWGGEYVYVRVWI